MPRESRQYNYGAGIFEEVRSSDSSIHKGEKLSRTAKTDVYIFLKKRPYCNGYMMQILLKFLAMITKKDTRLVQMVSTRSAILSCSYHRHCSVLRPSTKLQVMSIHTASRHAFSSATFSGRTQSPHLELYVTDNCTRWRRPNSFFYFLRPRPPIWLNFYSLPVT